MYVTAQVLCYSFILGFARAKWAKLLLSQFNCGLVGTSHSRLHDLILSCNKALIVHLCFDIALSVIGLQPAGEFI